VSSLRHAIYIVGLSVFWGERTHSWGISHSFFSCAEGVRPSEKGRLLPYLQRKYCKGFFLYCNQSFFVEEVGCQAHEHSL
jgi:hypothetical protein